MTNQINYKIKALTSTILFSGLLIGCGSSDPLKRPTKAKGTITTEMAQNLAEKDFASNFASAAMGTINGSSITSSINTDTSGIMLHASNLKSFSHALSSTIKLSEDSEDLEEKLCTPTKTPSGPIDADEDGIPVTVTNTFDCSNDSILGEFSITGTITMADKNDDDVFGGYTASMDKLILNFVSLGLVTTINAEFESTKNDASYTGLFDLSSNFTFTQGSQSVKANTGIFLDITTTPTDMNTPENNGAITLAGFIKVEASGGGANENINLVLQVSSEGLEYSNSCLQESGFNAGTLRLTDASANKIAITFDSECNATSTFNDTAISALAIQ